MKTARIILVIILFVSIGTILLGGFLQLVPNIRLAKVKRDRLPIGPLTKDVFGKNTIHITQIVKGKKSAIRSVTMLKSLLYFQNHLNSASQECLRVEPFETSPCFTELHPAQNPIHVHFITEYDLWPVLKSKLGNCSLPYLECSFYNLAEYQSFAERIPNTNHAGAAGIAKLWVPYILPHWVIRTIFVDTDTLWNENVETLWKIFDNFTSTQMLGIAWEQQSQDAHCRRSSETSLPVTGVNSGLVLMHLSRMRVANWGLITEQHIVSFLAVRKHLSQADQDIYNSVLALKPEWLYSLPCEWNVQVYSPVAVQCCPVIWPDRRPKITHECSDVKQTSTRSYGFLRIAHYNTDNKPEDTGWNNAPPYNPLPSGSALTNDGLRARFFDVYARFRKIPMDCFV
ncbi:LARGE xylosyl- and glucuronyltransferase 2-B [Clonorchis sinensis]|uniref:LARGE xylosyl- and glucuronyltransferase 2-B n=1 Tax=Clonorchis sinensis TaxID=79923 RepID=A0A3R7FZI7_CLOSI|nr:LARGE xylosyl- and glucuronyltransferase 2-B [Clonorchis sinensis]